MIRALNKLKQHGVRIALDDFGTGFSSLTHIRDYPIDSLKVDCSFIQKMQHDPSIYAIVQAIGLLAQIYHSGLSLKELKLLNKKNYFDNLVTA